MEQAIGEFLYARADEQYRRNDNEVCRQPRFEPDPDEIIGKTQVDCDQAERNEARRDNSHQERECYFCFHDCVLKKTKLALLPFQKTGPILRLKPGCTLF